MGGVVFGQQRDQAGVLIEPAPGDSIDVEDEVELSVFRNKIWYTNQLYSFLLLLIDY